MAVCTHYVMLHYCVSCIFAQAVALVVKYADNIYKGFGHSLSVVFCTTLSSFVFEDTSINETFLLGCFIVLASSVAYASMTANSTGASGSGVKESGFSSTGNLTATGTAAGHSTGHSGGIGSAGGAVGASSSIATSSAIPQHHYNVINHNTTLLMGEGSSAGDDEVILNSGAKNSSNSHREEDTPVAAFSDVEVGAQRSATHSTAANDMLHSVNVTDNSAVLSAPVAAGNDGAAVSGNINAAGADNGWWAGGFWERMNKPVSRRDRDS